MGGGRGGGVHLVVCVHLNNFSYKKLEIRKYLNNFSYNKLELRKNLNNFSYNKLEFRKNLNNFSNNKLEFRKILLCTGNSFAVCCRGLVGCHTAMEVLP